MKLKRILAGALAAVVSISTVALASLSTASAADALKAPSNGWYSGDYGKKELKIVEDWGNKTTWEAIEGKTELYFVVNVESLSKTAYASVCYSGNSYAFANWKPSEASPAVEISSPGEYVIKIDCTKQPSEGKTATAFAKEIAYCSIGFYTSADSSAASSYDVTAASLVGVYAEAPEAPTEASTEAPTEATTEAPTEPDVKEVIYEGSFATGERENTLYLDASHFEGNVESVTIKGVITPGGTDTWNTTVQVAKGNVEINAESVGDLLNAYQGGLTEREETINLTGVDLSNGISFGGYNYVITSVEVTYASNPSPTEATTGEEPTDQPQPTDQPTPSFDYTANLYYASADWSPFSDNVVTAKLTGEGEYALTCNVATDLTDDSGNVGYKAIGAQVLLIDIPGAAEYFTANGISLEVTSILCDGTEVPIIAPINQGPLEKDTDWRISLYNSTNEQGNSIDSDEIYAEETLTINFKVVKSEAPTEASTEATTEPTTEPCDVTVSITPDKAYALPGDEVTYTVAVTPNQPLYTLQMFMNMPEGLSYVPGSFVVDENHKAALGWNVDKGGMVEWTEDTLFLNGFSAASADITGQTAVLGSFKVVATELGTYTPAFDRYEFCNEDYETLTYGVAATPVEYVTEIPTEAPTEATTGEEPTDAPVTDPTVAPTTVKPTNAPDEPTTVATTTAATTTAPTTSGNNGNKNDTPNTGAQAAVGLSIFMAAGLAGVVAIKKRRK